MTTTAQHTPGPVCTCGGSPDTLGFHDRGCPMRRLIAAAPRMLEALRALYELAPLSNDDAVQRVYSEVRAILRAVEG